MIATLASNVSVRGNLNDKFPLLTGKGKTETHLLLVISSDRGLCGGLNGSTVRFTKSRINSLVSRGRDVKVICVGRKAYEQLRSQYSKQIIENVSGVFRNAITYQVAQDISSKLVTLFDENQFDVCEVIYSKFKSAISQEQICKQIIPAPINQISESVSLESPMQYEPSEEEVLSELLPKSLSLQVYNVLLENSASEQGARMAAMEAATNNAGKMIKNLTLVYNRTRQANITKELIDIISGANTV
jgi:F-type H+-transporting ATPase subunit gamma